MWRRLGRACKRGRNLEGGFLPNAATPKRTGRALRNSQFAIRNGQGFFSGFHFGMDDWGERARPACGFGRRARTIGWINSIWETGFRRDAENGNRDGRAPHYGLVALSAIRNSQFEIIRASFLVFILG